MEELLKPFRICLYNKRDNRRFFDALVLKYNNLKTAKVTKNELLDFCLESDEIQEIFYKNFNNSEEIDNIYEEEINSMCNNNMKKSK